MVATQTLLKEIAEAFPPVPKPEGMSLMFHQEGCLSCELVCRHLEQHEGSTLPDDLIRWIHDDLSCFSAIGWRWLLPSYLRLCVTQDADFDPRETEFLIYSLGPPPQFEQETRERLSALSMRQIECLQHFLEWCQEHPHWADYCTEEIAQGLEFVATLQPADQ